jgi:hypothetical protein
MDTPAAPSDSQSAKRYAGYFAGQRQLLQLQHAGMYWARVLKWNRESWTQQRRPMSSRHHEKDSCEAFPTHSPSVTGLVLHSCLTAGQCPGPPPIYVDDVLLLAFGAVPSAPQPLASVNKPRTLMRDVPMLRKFLLPFQYLQTEYTCCHVVSLHTAAVWLQPSAAKLHSTLPTCTNSATLSQSMAAHCSLPCPLTNTMPACHTKKDHTTHLRHVFWRGHWRCCPVFASLESFEQLQELTCLCCC